MKIEVKMSEITKAGSNLNHILYRKGAPMIDRHNPVADTENYDWRTYEDSRRGVIVYEVTKKGA